MLALHLLEGWSLYRSPEGARAHYPGLPSDAGRAADGMEGFSRMAPLAAVMLVRGEDGLFRLGPATFRLGLLYRAGLDLAEQLRPALARLAGRTAETAVFYVREGDARLCLFRHESDRAVRHAMREGALLPLDRGAGGHVLAAFTGARGKRLAAVRASGLAMSLGERDPDIAAMAAPVFGSGGFVGALSVSGPIGRFGTIARPQLESALREEAAALSRALGAG